MSAAELIEMARVAAHVGRFDDALGLLGALGDLPSAGLWMQRANLLRELCRTEEALEALARAEALGSQVARLRRAILMPPIMGDEASIEADRARVSASLRRLETDPPDLDDHLHELRWLDFYLPYQGGADRPLRESLARVLRAAAPGLSATGPLRLPGGGAPRVGFCSSHLRNHTIGRLNEALITGLGAHGIQVVLLVPDAPLDAMARRMAHAAHEVVVLGRALAPAREAITRAALDVLHFPDLGMDPFTWLLAFARLAPVQTAGWGHPITSGLHTIDAFLASEALVPLGTEHHFTETVLRLPDPMTCWSAPPSPAPVSRAELGLPEGRVYLCPQNAFKLHPHFDRVLAALAEADPGGTIALLDPPRAAWREVTEARMGPELASRITWVRRQPRERFLALLASADVILDPFPFGGGHTSLEAIAVRTPLVTWPTDQLRGRISAAWYGVLGIPEGVVDSVEAYVERAVALAHDPAPVRRRLEAAPRQLFDRRDAVAAHAALFHQLSTEGGAARL